MNYDPLGADPLFSILNSKSIDVDKLQLELEQKKKTTKENLWLEQKDSGGNTLLILAAMHGSPNAVRLLLDHGAMVDAVNQHGGTALMAASGRGHARCVEVLLKHGADPSFQGKNGSKAMDLAIHKRQAEVIEILEKASANQSNETDILLSILATKPVDVNRLQCELDQKKKAQGKKNVDLERRDSGGNTLLILAALSGSPNALRLLLEHGAIVDAVNKHDGTALMAASGCGHARCVEVLLKHGADPSFQGKNGSKAMDLAIHKKHAEVIEILRNASTIQSKQLLKQQHMMKQLDAINDHKEELFQKELRENEKVFKNELFVSAREIEQLQNEVKGLRADRGDVINRKDQWGSTSLMRASANGALDDVQGLLDHGVAINAANHDGWTALMYAASQNQTSCLEILLQRGADSTMKNWQGKTALDCAKEEKHDACALLLQMQKPPTVAQLLLKIESLGEEMGEKEADFETELLASSIELQELKNENEQLKGDNVELKRENFELKEENQNLKNENNQLKIGMNFSAVVLHGEPWKWKAVSKKTALASVESELFSHGGSFLVRAPRPTFGYKLVDIDLPTITSATMFTKDSTSKSSLGSSQGHKNTDMVAAQQPNLEQKFTLYVARSEVLFRFSPKTSDQTDVLELLGGHFHAKMPGSRSLNTLYAYHPCSVEVAEKIMTYGFLGLAKSGKFGTGVYLTLNAEYACQLSSGVHKPFGSPSPKSHANYPSRYPIILCTVCVGMAYPVTPSEDYPTLSRCRFFGQPLEPQFDVHFATVHKNRGFEAVEADDAQYGELVVGNEAAVYPMAILWVEPKEQAHGRIDQTEGYLPESF